MRALSSVARVSAHPGRDQEKPQESRPPTNGPTRAVCLTVLRVLASPHPRVRPVTSEQRPRVRAGGGCACLPPARTELERSAEP